jgi:hypothetical protein
MTIRSATGPKPVVCLSMRAGRNKAGLGRIALESVMGERVMARKRVRVRSATCRRFVRRACFSRQVVLMGGLNFAVCRAHVGDWFRTPQDID